MSNQSVADTFVTTVKEAKKTDTNAKPGIVSPPHFGDVGKAANDTFSKDFPVSGTKLEVKTKTPNGVQFTVKGSQDPKVGSISGELEGKYTDGGIALTQGWTTLNALNTKIELDNQIAKGVKLELGTTFLPSVASKNAKLGIHYRQPALHARAFLDLFKGPTFTADAVVAHEGFLMGGDIGYDVMDGRITKYAAAVGYTQVDYTATVQAHNDFKTFSASYHHRVTPLLEAAGKASFDPKATSGGVALEVAAKYLLDKDTFVKGKINNNGIAALSYVQTLRPGIKVGIGASIDTQHLQEAAHKFGLSLEASG